jgi:hypothetical protein
MRTAAICPTCATYENAVCIIYNGVLLTTTGIAPLDNLEVALGKINTTIGNVITLINNVSANPITLTTEGSSGPAELTGTALNIPDYTITLTTNGNSGPATFVNNDLNIPEYEFSLQDVLDINNTATTSIEIEDSFIEARDGAADNVAGLDGVNGNFYLKTGGGQLTSISATNVTGSAKALELPNVNGTLVASVNGSTADAAGNVTISGGSGNTTTVKRTLTSAEILALNVTEITLATATAGKTIVPISAYYKLNVGTTPYSGGNISMFVYYSDGGSGTVGTAISFFNVSNSQDAVSKANCNFNFATVPPVVLANNKVVLYALSALTLGNGTVDVYFTYAEL